MAPTDVQHVSTEIYKTIRLPTGVIPKSPKRIASEKYGTKIQNIGAARLNQTWELTAISLASIEPIKYKKEVGEIVEKAQFSIAIVIEVFANNVPSLIAYTNVAILPVGAPGPKTSREVTLTGLVNLPQPIMVQPGQPLDVNLFYYIASAEGPEKPEVYEGLYSIFIEKSVPVEMTFDVDILQIVRNPISI